MSAGIERPAAGRPVWALFSASAVAVAILDQLAKAVVVDRVRPGDPVVILGEWLRITLVQNSGAIFGMFRDQAILFAAASLLVVVLIVGFHARAGRSPVLSLALGLLLGGAIGNLVDRIRFGYVVDFVDMGIGTWRFYTYNVADASITIAIGTLLVLSLVPGLGDRFLGSASSDGDRAGGSGAQGAGGPGSAPDRPDGAADA